MIHNRLLRNKQRHTGTEHGTPEAHGDVGPAFTELTDGLLETGKHVDQGI